MSSEEVRERARLVAVAGPDSGKVFVLDGDAVPMGRGPGDGLRLNDPRVSRDHAMLLRSGGFWILRDQGSANGVLLNGMPAGEHHLVPGDELQLGSTTLRMESGDGRPVQQLPTSGIGGVVRAFRRLTSLVEIASTIRHQSDLDALLGSALDVVLEETGAARGVLLARSGADWTPRVWRGFPGEDVGYSRSLVNQAIENGRCVLVQDALSDCTLGQARSIRALRMDSVMTCPLARPAGPLAVLQVFHPAEDRPFVDEDCRYLDALASQLAVCLENARLMAELRVSQEAALAWQRQLETRVSDKAQAHNEALARLVENERKAAVGELAGGIAHRFNSPLAAILGLIQVMRVDDSRNEDLALVEGSALKIRDLVRELSTLTDPSLEDYALGAQVVSLEPRPGRVLVLDDEPAAARAAARILGQAGFEVIETSDAAGARDAWNRGGFDCALLDMVLGPGEDGLSLAREWLAADAAATLVLFTGHVSEELARNAGKLGVWGFLEKPCRCEDLRLLVGQAVERRRIIQKNRWLEERLAVWRKRTAATQAAEARP